MLKAAVKSCTSNLGQPIGSPLPVAHPQLMPARDQHIWLTIDGFKQVTGYLRGRHKGLVSLPSTAQRIFHGTAAHMLSDKQASGRFPMGGHSLANAPAAKQPVHGSCSFGTLPPPWAEAANRVLHGSDRSIFPEVGFQSQRHLLNLMGFGRRERLNCCVLSAECSAIAHHF